MQIKKEMESIKKLTNGLASIFEAESSNGDLNDFVTPGIFQGNVFSNNLPPNASNGYGFLIVIARNEINGCQIYLDRSGYDIFFRYRSNNELAGWKKISATSV